MKITLIIFAALILYSCNSNQPNQANSSTPLEKDSVIVIQDTSISVKNDCVRGIPEPVIEKEDYPNAVFTLSKDSTTAIENIQLENGDALTITHTGCEYYTLKFRFETTKYSADTNDLRYWYSISSTMLTGMLSTINAPIDIKRGIMYLGFKTAKPDKDLHLNEEIDFGGKDMHEFVSLDRIEKLSDKKYAVEITFSKGPL